MTEPKRYVCAFCGKDMGPWTKYSMRGDTCGERECERWAQDEASAEREEAHRDLDKRMGWL